MFSGIKRKWNAAKNDAIENTNQSVSAFRISKPSEKPIKWVSDELVENENRQIAEEAERKRLSNERREQREIESNKRRMSNERRAREQREYEDQLIHEAEIADAAVSQTRSSKKEPVLVKPMSINTISSKRHSVEPVVVTKTSSEKVPRISQSTLPVSTKPQSNTNFVRYSGVVRSLRDKVANTKRDEEPVEVKPMSIKVISAKEPTDQQSAIKPTKKMSVKTLSEKKPEPVMVSKPSSAKVPRISQTKSPTVTKAKSPSIAPVKKMTNKSIGVKTAGTKVIGKLDKAAAKTIEIEKEIEPKVAKKVKEIKKKVKIPKIKGAPRGGFTDRIGKVKMVAPRKTPNPDPHKKRGLEGSLAGTKDASGSLGKGKKEPLLNKPTSKKIDKSRSLKEEPTLNKPNSKKIDKSRSVRRSKLIHTKSKAFVG